MSESQRICEIVEYDNVKYTIVEIGRVKNHQESRENEDTEIIDLDSDFECGIASNYIAKAKKMVQRRKPVNVEGEKSNVEEIIASDFLSVELTETSGSQNLAIKKPIKRLQPLPEQLFCFKCGEILTSVENFRLHRRVVCASVKKVRCEICKKAIPENIISYHRLAHSKQKNLPCGFCKRKFKYESSRKHHLFHKHSNFF